MEKPKKPSRLTPEGELKENKEKTASIVLDWKQEENLQNFGQIKVPILKDKDTPETGSIVNATSDKGRSLGKVKIMFKEKSLDSDEEEIITIRKYYL